MTKHIILGVHIDSRAEMVPEVQSVFTQYGCHIKTRLGLHDVSETSCAPSGLVILEMFGDEKGIREMESRLSALPGVEVKKMVFGEK